MGGAIGRKISRQPIPVRVVHDLKFTREKAISSLA